MSNARKVFAVVLVAVASAVAPVAEAQPPIRIGATLSLTVIYDPIGQDQNRGYQLCVKHVNEKGGVLGRKLDLVLYDDGFDPATAVRLYEKLITQDKVDLVLGPYASPITDAVANVTEKHHNTVFGGFRVDRDGLQIAHKRVLFQWQDGKKVIVWPEELAPGKPRFPTPPWSQR